MQHTPYTLPVLGTAIVVLAAAAFVRSRAKKEATTREFVLGSAMLALTAASYAAELASASLAAKVFWLAVRYIGICVTPLTTLRLALRWSGNERWLAPRRFATFCLVPAITLVLAWTDSNHHWMSTPHVLVARDGFVMRQADAGPAFWAFALYAYFLMGIVSVIYARAIFGSSLRRRQGAILLLATLAPWAANFVYLSGLSPDPLLDLSPFGFASSTLLIALGLLHGRLFDLAPIARDVVFEGIADPVLVVDADARVLDWNPAAAKLFGRKVSDSLGVALSTLCGAETAERIIDRLEVGDLALLGRTFELRSAELRSPGGVRAKVLTLHDVSEQRALQAARDAALALARSAAAAREEFLTRMSHEVRGPLHGVLGAADLLGASRLEPMQQKYADAINASAGSLLALVDEILDHARLHADRIELEIEEVHAASALEAVARMFGGSAEKKGLRIEVEAPSELAIRADANRLRQVLVNLVANALKFTDVGRITLRASREGERATIEVADTGVGIPVDAHARVFEPFEVGATARDGRSGSGLGLSIARRLIEQMGGTITLESAPDRGTTFRVSLPSADARPEIPRELAEPLARAARSARVLVVDDHEISRLVTRGMLEREGCVVELAASAAEALALCAERRPDLVVTDLRMPGADGLELAAQLRARDHRDRPTPIVVLTGDVHDGAREQALAAGASEWLSKPLDTRRLREVLDAVLGPSAPSRASGDVALSLDALARVLDALRASVPGEIARIELDLSRGHLEEARAAAHSLAGAASMVGAIELAAACRAVESGSERLPGSLAAAYAAFLSRERSTSARAASDDATAP